MTSLPADLAANPERAAGCFIYGLSQLNVGHDCLDPDHQDDHVAGTVLDLAATVAEQQLTAETVDGLLLRRVATLTIDMLATAGMTAEVHAAAVRQWLIARGELAEQRQQTQQTWDGDHSDDDEE